MKRTASQRPLTRRSRTQVGARTRAGVKTMRAVVAIFCLLLQACAAEVAEPAETDALAPSEADGEWQVLQLEIDGSTIELDNEATLEIETEFASVKLTSPCNVKLGSLTILPDGVASFTLPGGSNRECSKQDKKLENQIVATLEATESWDSNNGQITFTGTKTSIALQR